MGSIRARVDALCTRLTDAGITATIEAQDVPVPGAWVTVRRAKRERMCPTLTLTVDVYLITGDAGGLAALDNLDELLALALTVCRPTGEIALDEAVILPHDPTPLPAAKLTLTLD